MSEEKAGSKADLFQDSIDAVYNDSYRWICVWGPPRCTKTTLAGWILYFLYKEDWNKVLQATVFNLEQVIHHLRTGTPDRQYTLNGLHNRVPGLNWDDFGAYSNKAQTQHESAWDHFKGGFDVLGTKVANLISTMVDPSEPTQQLNAKFTHEVQITSVGHYKYDKIDWRQDFRSNRIRLKKIWLQTGSYDPWPSWVYKEYDQERCSLAEEVFQRIEDTLSDNNIERVLKILKPIDKSVLKIIDSLGHANKEDVVKNLPAEEPFDKNALIRLKARNLIVPVRLSANYYKYDLTQLGRDTLMALEAEQTKQQVAKEIKVPSV